MTNIYQFKTYQGLQTFPFQHATDPHFKPLGFHMNLHRMDKQLSLSANHLPYNRAGRLGTFTESLLQISGPFKRLDHVILTGTLASAYR